MKKLLLLLLMAFIAHAAVAQTRTVERHFNVNSKARVRLNLKFGKTITVESWQKNEVAFQAEVEINHGKLNDALQFRFNNDDDRLEITADYDKAKIQSGHAGDCKGDYYSKYSVSGGNNNYTVCAHITYQVFVPEKAHLHIKSIDGNIKLQNLAGPVYAKSISGFVDLSMPAAAPARLDLKTISGDVYTDFDIETKNHQHSYVGEHIQGNLNGGGPLLTLKSISGNIYIRKTGS